MHIINYSKTGSVYEAYRKAGYSNKFLEEHREEISLHKAVFRMYDTDEPKEVSLFCHVSAMKYLIDNFGQRFWSVPVDEEYFRAKVRVCTSTTFYRWIFGFTGRIRIEGPEETVEEYREQIRSAAKENGVL